MAFLKALVGRNLLFAVVALVLYAPFVIFAAMSAGKTYESKAILKYDGTDALDGDAAAGGRTGYAFAFAFLMEQSTDADFYRQLPQRYYVEEPESRLDRLPIPASIRMFLPKRARDTSPAALEKKAKLLRSQLLLYSDLEMAQSSLIRLTAYESTADGAQRLATVAGQLLIDLYYAEQAKHALSIKEVLGNLLSNEQIKTMVEKAEKTDYAGGAGGSGRERGRGRSAEGKGNLVELKQRQSALTERTKDLNFRISAARERKAKIEGEIATLAKRYGNFHPQIRALQDELADIKTADTEKALREELLKTQSEAISIETETADPEAMPEPVESVDKVVQKLSIKLDRYNLELFNLDAQVKDPAQRVRLAMLGVPTLSFDPISSKKAKVAGLAGGAGIGLILVLCMLREFMAPLARDPWVITWRFQLPCLALWPAKKRKDTLLLTPDAIKVLRLGLLAGNADSKAAALLLRYRELSHWMYNDAKGRILLFAKASDHPNSAQRLHELLNVYCSDYSAKCLVLDFDARDMLEPQISAAGDGSILDFLAGTKPWLRVCRRADSSRAYDLAIAPYKTDNRLAELINSPRLSGLIEQARSTYHTVIILGLGPEQFVENNALLSRATDCIIVSEVGTTTYQQLQKLVGHLHGDKISGFIQIYS